MAMSTDAHSFSRWYSGLSSLDVSPLKSRVRLDCRLARWVGNSPSRNMTMMPMSVAVSRLCSCRRTVSSLKCGGRRDDRPSAGCAPVKERENSQYLLLIWSVSPRSGQNSHRTWPELEQCLSDLGQARTRIGLGRSSTSDCQTSARPGLAWGPVRARPVTVRHRLGQESQRGIDAAFYRQKFVNLRRRSDSP